MSDTALSWKGHIKSRFDGRIFLADTGMLSSFYTGGRASAVEIGDGVFRAIYLDGDSVQLYPPPASAPEATDVLEPQVIAP